MPILTRRLRFVAAAAAIAVAACAVTATVSAQVPPLLIGPNRVGSAVTYHLTTVAGASSAQNVQTVALSWKVGQKVTVMLTSADDPQPTPYVATRAADGTLALDNLSPDDTEGQRVAAALGVLNRLDGFMASAPAGAKTWNTTLVVQPQARPNPPQGAPVVQSTPEAQPLTIPLAATRSDDASGTMLAASGSANHTVTHSADAGSPRGGRGMGGSGGLGGGIGGGGMGRRGGMGGMGSLGAMGAGFGSGPKSVTVTTTITVDAHFGRDGTLLSGRIVETNQSADDESPQNQDGYQNGQGGASQPLTRSWQIERARPT